MKSRNIVSVFIAILGGALFYSQIISPKVLYADMVYTNDGDTIRGLVVEEHCDRIVFSTADGENVIFKEKIDNIFFDELEQSYYDIANMFLREGNFEHAEKFYIKSKEVNPNYKIAGYGLARLNDIRTKEIKKYKTQDYPATLKKQLGISIVRDGDFCKVDRVFADNIELHKNDALVLVWDESVKFMDEGEIAKRVVGIPDTPLRLTIRRKIRFSLEKVPWYFRVLGFKKEDMLPLMMEEWQGLVVGSLFIGSLAAKHGLRRGDRITAIDGKSTRYMPLKKADKYIHTKDVELTIERDIELLRTKE